MSQELSRTLTIGVVGLGYWGPNLVRNAAASLRTDLRWLCDTDDSRLDQFAAQFPVARTSTDVAALLEDPDLDAVAIATPVGTHHALASAALDAGKHVLVEKPMAASVDEAADLVRRAREADRVLMVDHVFLYSPPVRKLDELLSRGELGDLVFVDSVRINLGLVQQDVDVIWDLAPHDLSIMDHLIGREARSIVATGSGLGHSDDPNLAYLHIDYGDGLLASVHVNWLSPVKIRHFLLGGTRKSVLYNDLDRSEPVKVYDRGVDVDVELDPEGKRQMLVSYRSGDVISPKVANVEPLSAMIEHFADCCQKGIEPISSAEQGLRVVRLLAAAGRSLREGGTRVDLT